MIEQSLIYRHGGRLHALALRHVIEIMRPLPIDPAGKAAPCLIGSCTVRGEPTPIIDLAPLSGPSSDEPARLVTIRAGARRFAFLADEVLGVRSLPARAGQPLTAGHQAFLQAVESLDADLCRVLQAILALPDIANDQADEEAWEA